MGRGRLGEIRMTGFRGRGRVEEIRMADIEGRGRMGGKCRPKSKKLTLETKQYKSY